MKLSEFHYLLPPDRIAQQPLPDRSGSRLLVVSRKKAEFKEARFRDLPALLEPGDLLVVNDVRVAPLRITGQKPSGGRVELTLVKKLSDDEWEALIRGRKPAPGLKLELTGGLAAEILGLSGGEVRVSADTGAPLWRIRIASGNLEAQLAELGLPPLPPYIHRAPDDDPARDRERYQTVYAREGLAAAAPTAGLHFTPALLDKLEARGIRIARLRLDVSYGTFAPVRAEEIEDHHMHPENFWLARETAELVERARAENRRVVAVGTTVARTLEHCASENGRLRPGEGETALFIYPGFKFKVVSALVTNFHMPGSTLIMLVAAFAGRELILKAYQYALDHGFRFLSYGDAMLILD